MADAATDAVSAAVAGTAIAPGIGPVIGGGLGALAGIIGGIFGQSAGSGMTQQQMQALQTYLTQVQGLDAPTAASLMAQFQQEKIAGTLTPQMQAIVQQGPSAIAGYQNNPATQQAQTQALQSLQQQGVTGLSATDRAALMQVQQQAAGQAAAMNRSALANSAARGIVGSGNTLAAQLMGAQQAANQGATGGLNIAGQAQQAALQAKASAGALGGQMQAQQFAQAAQQANMQDAISRFNAANQQNVLGQNTSAANAAQQYNLTNAQQVANANTNIANQQAQQHVGATQTGWSDILAKMGLIGDATDAVAGQFGKQGTQQANAAATVGEGVGDMISAGAPLYQSIYNNATASPAKTVDQGTNTSD